MAYVMNVPANFIFMMKGMELGTAPKYDKEVLKIPCDGRVGDVQEKVSSLCGNIHDQIKCIIDNYREHLSQEQLHQLTECLVDFQSFLGMNLTLEASLKWNTRLTPEMPRQLKNASD